MKKLTTLLLLLASLTCYAQKETLSLNLKPDSIYNLVANVHTITDLDVPDHHMVFNTVISTTVAHRIIAIADSVYELELQYKAISYHMDMGEMSNTYSTGPEGRRTMFSTVARGMLNKSFYITVSKWGKVLAVKGLDSVYNGMFGALPDISDAQKAIFKSQMAQSFGEKSIRSNFQQVFNMFPQAPVAINDKWEANNIIESALAAKAKAAYTLLKMNGGEYLIHGETAIMPQGDDEEFKQSLGWMMRFKSITGSGITELKLHKKTCWVDESKITETIKCTAEVQASAINPKGLIFPMTVVIDITATDK